MPNDSANGEPEDSGLTPCLAERDAVDAGFNDSWDIASYFGVPEEMVLIQPPMRMESDMMLCDVAE